MPGDAALLDAGPRRDASAPVDAAVDAMPPAGDAGGCPRGRIGVGCTDVDWNDPPSDLFDSDTVVSDGMTDMTIKNLRITGAARSGIFLKNCRNIVIQNVEIADAGDDGIRLEKCSNVTIRNSYIHDANRNVNLHSGYAVFLRQTGDSVHIVGNWFENSAGGVRVSGADDADDLLVSNNWHKNAQRPDGGSSGQLIIFAETARLTNARVVENVSLAVPGVARNEDHINFYRSGGTAASPVLVSRNRIRGSGESRSDCGIIVGDTGRTPTAPASAYVTVDGNILVDPAQCGIGVTGGHDHIIINNRVFSSRNYENIGKVNVGIVPWRQRGEPGTMFGNTIGGVGQENWVLWWSAFRDPTPSKNPRWFSNTGADGISPNHGTLAEGNVPPTGWNDNDFDHTAWDADGGNAGYAELWEPAWDAWAYYPGT